MHKTDTFLSRHSKTFWRIFTLALLIASATCLIVDIAVTGQVTWAWIPILSMGLAFGIVSAFLFGGKNRLWATLLAIAVLIVPYLLLLERLLPNPGWAMPLAVPISGMGVVYLAAALLMLHIPRINWLNRLGLIVVGAAPLTYGVNYLVSRYVGQAVQGETYINLFSNLAVAALLFFLGSWVPSRAPKKRQQAG